MQQVNGGPGGSTCLQAQLVERLEEATEPVDGGSTTTRVVRTHTAEQLKQLGLFKITFYTCH